MDLRPHCDQLLRQYGLPAIGLARISPRGIEGLNCLGERKFGSGIAVTDHDLWHIGSCTKSMTATMIARLVERGLFDWDLPIAPLFINGNAPVHPGFGDLTLRHLLTHRSGMPRDPEGASVNACYDSGQSLRVQRDLIAREAMLQGPLTRPGEVFSYSNLGYLVAGMVVEGLAGAAWEDLMRREVFSPLGLASAGFGAPGCKPTGALGGLLGGGILGGLLGQSNVSQPWGHQPCNGPEIFTDVPPFDPGTSDNKPVTGPAGTIHLSLPDLCRYVAFHASRGATAAGYLRTETVDFLHTSLPGEDYALGWGTMTTTVDGFCTRLVCHEGSNGAWYTIIMMTPDLGRAWVLVSNTFRDSLQDPQSAVLNELAALDNYWIGRAPQA
jgi:CubicO group peptidase (beta-lactamase class C family)